MTSPAIYLLVLILPWVLCVLSFKLNLGPGLDNLRLFLYALTFIVAAIASATLVTTDEVMFQVSSEGYELHKVTGTSQDSNTQNYTFQQLTTTHNVTMFNPDAGVGRASDAYLFAMLYLGLTLLYFVLFISEVFRIAARVFSGGDRY